MKKLFLTLLAVLSLSISASAQSPLSGLGSLLGLGGSATQTDSTSTSTGTGSSGLGDLISGVAGALGLGNQTASIEKLTGTWNYSSPAVAFQSDNFLMKAGGAAAAQSVEAKLEPYYKKAGLTKLVLTINEDSTFTFKTAMMKLSGRITLNPETKQYTFQFQALKAINIGSMDAYIQLTGSQMDLTFDVSKLMALMQKISAFSGSSSLKTMSAILNQYDGMTAGFTLKKSA